VDRLALEVKARLYEQISHSDTVSGTLMHPFLDLLLALCFSFLLLQWPATTAATAADAVFV